MLYVFYVLHALGFIMVSVVVAVFSAHPCETGQDVALHDELWL